MAVLLAACSGAALPARDLLRNAFSIYRDEYGVPHIVGDTEEAAFFGYGYAQAQDHLERMMIQYRDAQGRRAEVEGPAALGGEYLRYNPHTFRWDGDYLQRLLRTKRAVVENRGRMECYGILDAFARGVNAYIREHRASIPAWIDSISAEDVEALERSHYMRFYSIHDALSKLSRESLPHPHLGSNHWAIAPSKSANGRVMHVEHLHMPWGHRFQKYEAHLMVPGKLNAGGVSWFGSPFFLAGFNDRITWSVSWNQPNIADVYEEKINPRNHLEYLYEGAWRPVRVEHETILVNEDGRLRQTDVSLYYTHHGPIVGFDAKSNRAWSVKLPNFDGVNYSTGLYGLMKAGTLAEFKAALARQLLPRWNVLYTDSANIYWVHNGNVARRAEGFNWRKPVPGWTGQTEWGTYLPFAVYPQLLNPASGWLQNCNNPPWVATRGSGLNPLDPAPYYLAPGEPRPDAGEETLNLRGERLTYMLSQPRKFTLQDTIALGFDTYVVPAGTIIPLLEKANARAPEPRAARALELFRQWDRRAHAGSAAFTWLYYWARSYDALFPGKLQRFISYYRREIDLDSGREQKMAMQALVEAGERLRKQFGRTEVRWGEVATAVRGGRFPVDGSDVFDLLHPESGEEQPDGRIQINDGWAHLMVVMEGNPKEIWSLLPYGQSEDPASPHYNDQARLHAQRRLKRFWFTPEEILAHAQSVLGRRGRLRHAGTTVTERRPPLGTRTSKTPEGSTRNRASALSTSAR